MIDKKINYKKIYKKIYSTYVIDRISLLCL